METIQLKNEAYGIEQTNGMVLIPAGSFQMGSNGWGEFEKPIHEVYLDEFYMDISLVTNAEFNKFVQKSGYISDAEKNGKAWGYQDGNYTFLDGLNWKDYATPDRTNHPVVLVSWNDAMAYTSWVGKRLPSEAEWEKAAQGGLGGVLYPWGNDAPNGTQSNYSQTPSELPPTTPINNFPPNNYGLNDMVGNVWQWCSDWHGANYYSMSPFKNPEGPEVGMHKVRRGGSWNVVQSFRLRNSNRGAADLSMATPNIGFRCCL